MKNYQQTATDVLRLIGGEKNVSHLEHCSTRLRLSVIDPEKVDKDGLKKTQGVMGVIASGQQCQIVIGNDVIEVYNELLKLGSFNGNSGGAAAPKGGKKNYGAMALDLIVGIFQPLVPAIAGAGILKALLTLCTTFGWLTADNTIYQVLVNVGDAALYFLPIMVAVTTASKLNANKLVAVALSGAMILPATTTLLATEGGATLFGFTLQKISYSGQVFPSILIVSFMAILEHWLNKVSPKVIRVFFVPLVCFAVTFPVALLVLGPLGYNIGTLLTAAILALYNSLGWLAVGIVGAILPFMVSLGMHKALVPYALASISSPGFDMLYLPASLAHNISEGGAALGVALKTKDKELRSTAISVGVTAIFGITEPALYGVTLQHKRVMMSVCASGFISGLFIGLMKIKAFAAVGPGIPSMAMYIDADNGMNIVWAIVAFVLSLVLSFLFALILYHDPEKTDADDAAEADVPAGAESDSVLVSPLAGKVIPLSEVKDEVFSQGILGSGMAVIPTAGALYAPADGTVDTVFDSKHAISMVTGSGAELLIHVGLDTVKMGGKGYDPQVKSGEKVHKGQLLMRFDLDAIKDAGYDVVTPIIVTNADHYTIHPVAAGEVRPGAVLMNVEVKA